MIAQRREMEKVIEQDDERPTAETITLPSLWKLTLLNLPQLCLISKSEMKSDSMHTIAVWNCRRL